MLRYWFNGKAGVLVCVKNIGLLRDSSLSAFHWYVFSFVNLKHIKEDIQGHRLGMTLR